MTPNILYILTDQQRLSTLKTCGATPYVLEERRLGRGYVPMFGILEGPEESTVPCYLTGHTLEQIDRCAQNSIYQDFSHFASQIKMR